ncbi:hypothetical protein EI94DRAFT_383422 [Lactarius quietus]|nr:hypothetical protein EI94DRAFT_383422 [Lactarius quietus]
MYTHPYRNTDNPPHTGPLSARHMVKETGHKRKPCEKYPFRLQAAGVGVGSIESLAQHRHRGWHSRPGAACTVDRSRSWCYIDPSAKRVHARSISRCVKFSERTQTATALIQRHPMMRRRLSPCFSQRLTTNIPRDTGPIFPIAPGYPFCRFWISDYFLKVFSSSDR